MQASICDKLPYSFKFPVFAALEAGRLPHDAKPYMAGDTLVQPGEPLNGYIPDPGVLPEAFQSMTAQVARELSDAAQRSWRVLHWRHNISASDRVLNQLRDTVSKRNQLTHRDVNTVDGQFLKETIYAVSDCLR